MTDPAPAPQRLYLDCEFTGLTQHTRLISLALCSDGDAAFYAELTDWDRPGGDCDPWVREHVIPATRWLRLADRTPMDDQGSPLRVVLGERAAVAAALTDWLRQWPRIQVWGDCPAYDWVLFCELFGGARGLPAAIDYIPRDLATLLALHGLDPDLDRDRLAGIARPAGQAHNALWDARAIRACCRRLLESAPG